MNEDTPNSPPATLSDADAAVLDALLEARAAGAATGPIPPGSAERAEKMRQVLDLLALDQPGEPATEAELEALTTRVLEDTKSERQRMRFAQQAQTLADAEPRGGFGFAWRQAMTVAAVLLIGVSLLLPVMDNTRNQARQTACASNLAGVGNSFAGFAQDHHGATPRYAPTQPASAWWRVGQASTPAQAQSNSANLYILVRAGYADAQDLNCPANEHAPAPGQMTASDIDYANHQQISYSYQNQFRLEPIQLDDGSNVIALLADRNPLFYIRPGQFRVNTDTATTAPSVVHGKRGQNVLFSNGEVRWVVRPNVERADCQIDNIWTAAGVDTYNGTEVPTDEADSFLVP